MADYPLTPVQKRIVREAGKDWRGGDDNDFSCFLSSIAREAFEAGRADVAWQIHQNDPLAVECSYERFCECMQEQVDHHREHVAQQERAARHLEQILQ